MKKHFTHTVITFYDFDQHKWGAHFEGDPEPDPHHQTEEEAVNSLFCVKNEMTENEYLDQLDE